MDPPPLSKILDPPLLYVASDLDNVSNLINTVTSSFHGDRYIHIPRVIKLVEFDAKITWPRLSPEAARGQLGRFVHQCRAFSNIETQTHSSSDTLYRSNALTRSILWIRYTRNNFNTVTRICRKVGTLFTSPYYNMAHRHTFLQHI